MYAIYMYVLNAGIRLDENQPQQSSGFFSPTDCKENAQFPMVNPTIMEQNIEILYDIAASMTKYDRTICGMYSIHDSRYGLCIKRQDSRNASSVRQYLRSMWIRNALIP